MNQTFREYMRSFLSEKKAKTVVEVGSDVQLKLALNLAPHCERFYSVNFPEHHAMMQGWYELHQDYGVRNIELLSGNAVNLSTLITHADVIILQNVLLDLTGKDTPLLLKYRRGESECSDEQWRELASRFEQAEEQGVREFLKVANPGYVVRFGRPEENGKFRSLLVDRFGIDPRKVEMKGLLYDETREEWEAYIINNVRQ